MKRVLTIVGGVLALVLLVGAGGYVYAGAAAEDRLAIKYEVEVEGFPIPFPLTQREIEALREQRRAAAKAAAPAPEEAAPPTQGAAAEGEANQAEAGEGEANQAEAGEGETAGAEAAEAVEPEPQPEPDPLEGVDLKAIAMQRAVARGHALVVGRLGCAECHGDNGQGKLVVDAQPVWTWYAPNITRGGVTKDYAAGDWDRIIRHGVKPDGTPATMPAIDYMSLSDRDVSDLAAYFHSRPPSDVVQPATVLGPVGKGLIGFGKMPISAEEIDHTKGHPVLPPAEKVDVEFGAHVAASCVGCHRTDYSGGPIAQGPPDWPPAANLTPHAEGRLAGWTEEDFIRVLRQGKRPDGSALLEPMASVTKMQISETEMRALFMYLQQLPPVPTGK